MTRHTVHFTGTVQGVGFRFSTTSIAQHYRVAGYVRNLPDGRVRVVAEGEDDQVQTFVEAVQQRMSRYIHETQMDRGAATGEFGRPGDADSFNVRR